MLPPELVYFGFLLLNLFFLGGFFWWMSRFSVTVHMVPYRPDDEGACDCDRDEEEDGDDDYL